MQSTACSLNVSRVNQGSLSYFDRSLVGRQAPGPVAPTGSTAAWQTYASWRCNPSKHRKRSASWPFALCGQHNTVQWCQGMQRAHIMWGGTRKVKASCSRPWASHQPINTEAHQPADDACDVNCSVLVEHILGSGHPVDAGRASGHTSRSSGVGRYACVSSRYSGDVQLRRRDLIVPMYPYAYAYIISNIKYQ